ncbi:MAG: hypothetical protein B7Z30_07315 [Rhizobiales bacterium 12-68-15]|nr:MAG: hypothetical protein B7Z30_07315 [Rhizobiales bacterium 12-68-15]
MYPDDKKEAFMPAHAYPDDLRQSRQDARTLPMRQSQAAGPALESARPGTSGIQAPDVLSALSPIGGRDVLPGDIVPPDEVHWDAPLPVRIRLKAGGGVEIRTLRDAGHFISGRYMTLEHSAALQALAVLILTAARTGHPDDMADAGMRLHAYARSLHLN